MCWRSHTWLCYGWLAGVWKAGLQRSCSIPVPGTRDQTCSFRLIRQDLCHWGASPALSSIQVRSILKFLPLMYLPESMSFRALFKHSLLGVWGGLICRKLLSSTISLSNPSPGSTPIQPTYIHPPENFLLDYLCMLHHKPLLVLRETILFMHLFKEWDADIHRYIQMLDISQVCNKC